MRTSIMLNRQSKGQALVEMAIILPLLLLLVLGVFEFGRAMYIKNTLTHAARAGARAAVVTPGIANAGPVTLNADCNWDPLTGNNRVFQAVCNSLYSGIKKTDITVNIAVNDLVAPSGLGAGDMVEVKVTLNNYQAKYRVVPFIPVPDILNGTAAMRYE